jgi:ribosome-associated protein
MLYVNPTITLSASELQFRYDRSSGPGGQNVNKVNTKATLHWDLAGSQSISDGIRERLQRKLANRINRDGKVVIASQRYRDQNRNVQDCLEKLKSFILEAARPVRPRKLTRPTRGSKERRLQGKRRKSEKKRDRRPPSHGE